MTNSHLDIPTTIADFISFLEGDAVEPYGDQGTTVLDTLRTTLQTAIYKELGNPIIEGTPIDDFQSHVLTNHFARLFRPALRVQFPSVDLQKEIFDSCYSWVQHFYTASNHTPILISKPQVLSLVKTLFEDCANGMAPVEPSDDRIAKISEEFLLCLREYLADLRKQQELSHQMEPVTFESVQGDCMQERIDDGLLNTEAWQNAWNQEFRGKSLLALQTKLQLHAEAIKTGGTRAKMSRIIPVVQASGTGKSRLAEEYGFFLTLLMTCRFVKTKFGVMLSLRTGSGSFPRSVRLMVFIF